MLQPGTLVEADRTVPSEYLALLEYKLQRRDELDRRIEQLALTQRYKPLVDRIGCFRGFKTQAAMVRATELGDVRRFESPRQLMAYLGLVPGEDSWASDGEWARSPRPATRASDTCSFKPRGTTDGDPSSAPRSGGDSRARMRP